MFFYVVCGLRIVMSFLKRSLIYSGKSLELRQYDNEFVSVKRMPVLKFSPFSPCRIGEGKWVAISKQTYFFTEASPFLYCLSSKSSYKKVGMK